MMTTLFFILLFIPLFSELSDILNPSQRLDNIKKLTDYNKKKKENKEKSVYDKELSFTERQEQLKEQELADKEAKAQLKSLGGTIFTMLLYITLTIIGMMVSSQWILFGVLFIIGLLVSVIKKISKNTTYQNVITVVDSIICFTILLYIIINHFHNLNLIPTDLKGFVGMFV